MCHAVTHCWNRRKFEPAPFDSKNLCAPHGNAKLLDLTVMHNLPYLEIRGDLSLLGFLLPKTAWLRFGALSCADFSHIQPGFQMFQIIYHDPNGLTCHDRKQAHTESLLQLRNPFQQVGPALREEFIMSRFQETDSTNTRFANIVEVGR